MASTPGLQPQCVDYGHIAGVDLSPDGRLFALATDLGGQIFDTATGRRLHILSGHTDSIESVAFSPDGRQLLTGGYDHVAILWDVATGAEIRTFRGHQGLVHSAVFSPDGSQVLTSSWDHTVKLWNTSTGVLLRTFTGHTNIVEDAVFSPDGRQVLSCGYDMTARLWDAGSGNLVRIFSGHTDGIQTAVFSPDGKTILTGSFDKTAKLWEPATGRVIRTFSGHLAGLHSAIFSRDGSRIVTASWDNTAKLWMSSSGRLLQTMTGHTNFVLFAVFSPDGTRILTGSHDKTARLWDAATGKVLRSYSACAGISTTAAATADGQRFALGLGSGNTILMDHPQGTCIRVLTGQRGPVQAVAFSPDGRQVLTGSADKTARIWDVTTGAPLQGFTGHGGAVRTLAFSPNGRMILTGGEEPIARLWDIQSGTLLRNLRCNAGAIRAVAFSPDGRFALTGSDDHSLRLWNLATGDIVRTLPGILSPVEATTFSPDGKLVFAGLADHQVLAWNTADGHVALKLAGHTGPVRAIASSQDGRSILTGSEDGTARLWDTATGKELQRLTHTAPVSSVAFLPASHRILTTTNNASAYLWNLPSSPQANSGFRGHAILLKFLFAALLLAIQVGVILLVVKATRRIRISSTPGAERAACTPPDSPAKSAPRLEVAQQSMSRPHGSPSRRRVLIRVMAIAFALLIFLPIGELCIRIVLTLTYRNTLDHVTNEQIKSPEQHINFGQLIRLDPNPKLAYRMRPGIRAVYSNIRTQINSMGFRDDEITTAKAPGTLRVVGLGDSSMYGLGVFRDQSYMDLLENEFRHLMRDKVNVQFINTGTPGYNTTQEVELFLNSGLKLDPDAVLIQFDNNDINAPVGMTRPDFLFARHCFMAHLLALGQGEYSDLRAFYHLDQEDRLCDPRVPGAGWQNVADSYRRLAAVCRERQIPLYGILIFEDAPWLARNIKLSPLHQQVLALWRELGITPIQALTGIQTEYFKNKSEITDFIISKHDMHPNPAGHAMIAQAILPAMKETLLKKAGLQPAQLDQYNALGNIILRQATATGLLQPEQWDGYVANWTGMQAHFHFLPAGRKVVIPLMISHPDVSEAKPVNITLRIDGVPTARHPASSMDDSFSITKAGYTSRTIDISALDGCPLELSVSVSRTFHTPTDGRPMGVGLYEFTFIP